MKHSFRDVGTQLMEGVESVGKERINSTQGIVSLSAEARLIKLPTLFLENPLSIDYL